jgi:hypothetical protein
MLLHSCTDLLKRDKTSQYLTLDCNVFVYLHSFGLLERVLLLLQLELDDFSKTLIFHETRFFNRFGQLVVIIGVVKLGEQ